jgi:fructose-bisphosphate aldolase class I
MVRRQVPPNRHGSNRPPSAEEVMKLDQLVATAAAMVQPGKGILAADESSGTIKKRFDAIGVESTTENRRDYRELLFRSTEAMKDYVSGVILYDETIRQNATDGTAGTRPVRRRSADLHRHEG